MSARTAGRLAWALFVVYLALVALTFILHGPRPDSSGETTVAPALIGFALGGALIASRRPDNPIGWLVIGVTLTLVAQNFAAGYNESDGRPGTALLSWYESLAAYLWLGLGVIFLPLLFPDGRLLSPRWRWVARAGAAAIVVAVVAHALMPGPLNPGAHPRIPNPVGIEPLAGALKALGSAATALAVGVFAATVASMVLRFRRSRGEERLQLKWFALACSVMAVGFLLRAIVAAFPHNAPLQVVGAVGFSLGFLALIVGIPVATGVAVLRHRLYDIDVVINRTLVYGALTATLAGVYLGSVLLLQLALGPVTSGSSLAVAVSTLAVAALFRPARARIQAVVDRRFYRRKYDAARTLEGFSARLREQVDLDALGGELRAVVRETMQPAHVSLWLRAP